MKKFNKKGWLGTFLLALAVLITIMTFTGTPWASSVASQVREVPVYQVDREDKIVSVSFDAAWGAERTKNLLETLDKYEVKTTFFLVNTWLEKYPDLAKEIVARGHEIGLHSTTHPHFPQLSVEQMKAELLNNQKMIKDVTGFDAKIFRSPFGDYNNLSLSTAEDLGITTVQWSVDSLDWKGISAAEIEERVMGRIKPGDLVLFHNDGENTPQALDPILDRLTAEGYSIVPVSQILLTGDTYTDINGTQKQR